jgi:uncharacterized protein with von Willebrand factor type A (vWA) domain
MGRFPMKCMFKSWSFVTCCVLLGFVLLSGCKAENHATNEEDVQDLQSQAKQGADWVHETEPEPELERNNADTKRQAEEDASRAAEAEKKASKKQMYLEKLAAVEKSLANLAPYYESGKQSDLTQAEYDRYQRWDRALNEIWAQLRADMQAEQFSRLQLKKRR